MSQTIKRSACFWVAAALLLGGASYPIAVSAMGGGCANACIIGGPRDKVGGWVSMLTDLPGGAVNENDGALATCSVPCEAGPAKGVVGPQLSGSDRMRYRVTATPTGSTVQVQAVLECTINGQVVTQPWPALTPSTNYTYQYCDPTSGYASKTWCRVNILDCNECWDRGNVCA